MKINKMNVLALRNEQGWSQEDLAAATDVSVRTIQRVESEGVGSKDTVQALAAAFDTDVSKMCMPEQDWAWSRWTIKTALKKFLPLMFFGFVLSIVGLVLVETETISEITATYFAGASVMVLIACWADAFVKAYKRKYGTLDLSQIKWF